MEIGIATEALMPAVLALRLEVFVEEQRVPRELELDAEDAHATHIAATDGGAVIGCARVLLEEESAHIGRLAVRKDCRGRGIGAAVCRFAMAHCCAMGYDRVALHAQLHAVDFYKKLGFLPVGEIFMEAGIAHVAMVADLEGEAL